jgi:hypothetical protein
MLIVKCQRCGADLVLSKERAPACGRCGAIISLDAKPKLRQWSHWIRRLFVSSNRPKPEEIVAVPQRSNIKHKIDRLAHSAWGTREDISRTPLVLQPRSLHGLDGAAIIGAMLRHARHVAPRLNVPLLSPRVTVQPLCSAAGQFVEADGWVKITVGSAFFSDVLAAHAILSHELCHYVLNASGIREPSRVENERLTDAAMFVLGLGDTFLAGYRKAPSAEYRAGHRLGYLSDAEYRFAAGYVQRLRLSNDQFVSTEQEAETRLRAVVHDPKKRASLIAAYRRRYASATSTEVVQRILDDIARDNR